MRPRLLASGRRILPFGYCWLPNSSLLRLASCSGTNRRLNTPDSAQIHDAHRSARSRGSLAHLLDRSCRQWAAGILR